MAIEVIRVTPTLDTSAYTGGDVLFVGTEVVLPSKSCRLMGVQAILYDTEAAEINLLFFQKNEHPLGTINLSANVSAANLKLNKYLGALKLVGGSNSVDNAIIFNQQELNDSGATEGSPHHVMGLEVDHSVSANNHSIFIQGINAVGTGDYAADALEILLTVEY